jgi:outer membrane protein OmpA-like peptidoglycan-associated protein
MDVSKLTERQVLIGGAGLAALYCIFSLIFFAGPVSDIVGDKADDLLLIEGADWADIEINGRDITLVGEAPSAESGEDAVEALEAKWGVRVVRANFTIAQPLMGDALTASGPPIADADVCQTLMDSLLTDGGIQFETGKAALSDASAPLLDSLGAALLRCGGFKINIVGHTDNTGDPAANLELSKLRAAAVTAYLAGKGVPADQITASGAGSAEPIAGNDTDAGRAANRRIEFRVSQ